ncbi:MAG: cupin domain-containing protein [Chlorobiaceae bacterium]|nr:cupin domain-containing protein [Chlorobiaceae bacterium]
MRSFEKVLACLVFCLTWPVVAPAEDYPDIKAERLLVSKTAYNGQKLSYLSRTNPEVTVMTVTIPPGGVTGWHQHQVPVYAYVLEGELSVELKGGVRYRFVKGAPILEVMNLSHNGRNTGKMATTLLVFYTGAEGVDNVVRDKGNP